MNNLNHVAFIMDGNGRWGIKKGKGRNFGHLQGIETVKKIVKSSIKLQIPIITFFVFSSENWRRPKKEINFLFKLIKNYFSKEIKNILKQDLRINIFGNIQKLPSEIKNTLNQTINLTKKNKRILINLAINYGSKDEILNAAGKIGKKPTIKAPRNISPIVAIQYNKPHWKKLVGIANIAEKTIRNPPIVVQKELISHNGYL